MAAGGSSLRIRGRSRDILPSGEFLPPYQELSVLLI